jgi:hypothetical protein
MPSHGDIVPQTTNRQRLDDGERSSNIIGITLDSLLENVFLAACRKEQNSTICSTMMNPTTTPFVDAHELAGKWKMTHRGQGTIITMVNYTAKA